MTSRGLNRLARAPVALLGGALVVLLLVPLAALVSTATPEAISAGIAHPLFAPALSLSLRTSLISLGVVLLTGTPLAWWLATSDSRAAHGVSALVDLPVVIPPAVIGVALLQTFGRRGLLGPALESADIAIPFTSTAVVIAQVVVAAPFYVQSAASAFRKVDPDLLLVARTLGATRAAAFFRVAVPVALPGLIAGTSLAWARALGEFGATLLFAGNLTGATQTLPLAIYTALESDLKAALAFSLVLAAIAGLLLLTLRLAPAAITRLRGPP